jgi:hypothetical protein
MRALLIATLLGCSSPSAPVVDTHAVESSYQLPHCRGVWVSESIVATAAHCVRGAVEGEHVAPSLRVARVHDLADLALLEHSSPPSHAWATLSTGNHYGGEDVIVVGTGVHRGQVVAERWTTPPHGATTRAVQVMVSAEIGDSGGGAFDREGRLVGVCSFARDGDAFFVHARHVAELMGER